MSERRLPDDPGQTEADILRAAALILRRDAAALDDHESTEAEFGRLQRAAKVCDVASNCRKPGGFGDRLTALANELLDPMLCRTPAYGAPGLAHCAACCYGTGVIVTCDEEQAIFEAAQALSKAAATIYAPPVSGRDEAGS